MAHRNAVQGIRDAHAPCTGKDGVSRDIPGAPILFAFRRPDHQPLNAVAGQFVAFRARQHDNRLREPVPVPPVRIAPRQMHCRFSRASHRLAELVARHKQTFAEGCACRVELALLAVGSVGFEPVSA